MRARGGAPLSALAAIQGSEAIAVRLLKYELLVSTYGRDWSVPSMWGASRPVSSPYKRSLRCIPATATSPPDTQGSPAASATRWPTQSFKLCSPPTVSTPKTVADLARRVADRLSPGNPSRAARATEHGSNADVFD